MILDTFTKEELLSTLIKVIPIFKQRAKSYLTYNAKELAKKLKSGIYKKCITGVVDGQRYYYNVIYFGDKKNVDVANGYLQTVVQVGKRNLVIEFSEFEDPNSTDGSYIKILTEHFLTRFCERMGLSMENMSAIEKAHAFANMESGYYSSTVLGDFVKKYEKTRLEARFLETTPFKTWYASSSRGDIAIVEQYGTIPVWRTFISREMLFENQVNDPTYKMIKEMSEKQIKEADVYVPDFIFEDYRAQKK